MKRALFLGLLVLLGGAPAGADLVKGSQSIALFGGFGGSFSEYDYKPGTREPLTGGGGAFGGQYLYYFKDSPALALGADLTSSSNGPSRSGDLLSGTESTARLKSLVGLILVRLAYPKGLWRPYITGGVGVHDSSQQLSAQPQPGQTWTGGGTESRMLLDEHKTSAALGMGVGMDLYPKDNWFFGVEFRGTALLGLNTDDNAALRNAGYAVDESMGLNQVNLFFRTGITF